MWWFCTHHFICSCGQYGDKNFAKSSPANQNEVDTDKGVEKVMKKLATKK